MEAEPVRIGIAGWALENRLQPLFPVHGTHLQRYAQVFSCVEINSSFYRPHKVETYRRWALSVPDDFRFSAKVPKEITHVRRLKDFVEPLDRFLLEVGGLGPKLGPLLIQLPPSAAFHAETASYFLREFRKRFPGRLALEPRHATWFEEKPEELLVETKVARVAADPALVPAAARPGGWSGLIYRRLHGSPKTYYSDYSEGYLSRLSETLGEERQGGKVEVYCIFDNTALGHAIPNALALMERTRAPVPF